VAGREQEPLAAGAVDPAEQEVFRVLQGGHLPEHRFHDDLASRVGGPALLGGEFAGHPFTRCRVLADPASRRGRERRVVLGAAGGDEELGPARCADRGGLLQVVGRAVPGVGEHLTRRMAGVHGGLFGHRHQVGHVRGAVAHLGRDDHLMAVIDDRLGVEALVERPVGGLHDPRLRVGEVALRLRFRHRRRDRVGDPLRGSVLALTPRGGPLSGLLLGALPSLVLQCLLRFPDLGQPRLAAPQFLRQFVPA